MKTVILQIHDKDYDRIRQIANTPFHLVDESQRKEYGLLIQFCLIDLIRKITSDEGR